MNKIDTFITRLSNIPKSNGTTNLYFGNNRESLIRKNNLLVYLTKMKIANPKFLLLGEAPGYKGCRLSGIPFTSEKVLYENLFFKNEPIQLINEKGKLESEISATIVWSELSQLKEKPLMWNIFPFHPHTIESNQTNRTPKYAELEEGKVFLFELLEIFEIQKIIALGKKPESQLTDIGISNAYVRHPANGGKTQFILGLKNEMTL